MDLDIQGDYLIPAVVNKRPFLFWPVFTEVPDETANSTVQTPGAHENYQIQKTAKRLKVQLAVSDYRQGKWTPKRVSKDFFQSPGAYSTDVVHKFHRYLAVDRTMSSGRSRNASARTCSRAMVG